MTRFTIASVCLAALLVIVVRAESVGEDVADVPVERLVTNLEQLLAAKPNDPALLVNLARTHMMAYALKSGTIRATSNPPRPASAWLQENVLPQVIAAPNDTARRDAERHLTIAVQTFERAIAADRTNTTAHLGYAWALQQTGDLAKAIAAYRATIELSWPRESSRQPLLVGWRSITEEAARYLIPLLDPVRDQSEIVALNARRAGLQQMARAITPIVVPLRDDVRVENIVDSSARVLFDADGSGLPRRWTWITPDAGWLVFNPTHRPVTSALQLFGNVTFWLFWENGYDAMRSLDDDANGQLEGRELQGIEIWRDANRDGVSDPGESQSLAAWHITSLSCDFASMEHGEDAIAYSSAGARFDDGSSRPTYDILLRLQR